MIEFKNVYKTYKDKKIIENLNLTLPNKGMVLLKGDNGSGKTTLCNMIAQRIKYQGEIHFDKEFVFTNDLYYSFSGDTLYDFLSVEEKLNILLNESEKQLCYEYLDKFDLFYLLKRKFSDISSGEKAKIELVIVLSKRKKITIIDEPFEYIDVDSKPIFINEIRKLAKEVLVIETCHYDIHEADIVLSFNDGIKIEKFNENNEESCTKNKTKDNKVLKKSIRVFLKRPHKNIVLFNIFTILFICLITTFIKLSLVSDETIYNSFINSYINGGIYYSSNDYETNDIQTYQNKIFKNGDYKKNRIIDFDTLVDFNIIESNNIYYNGLLKEIKENEIYISDYLYDSIFDSINSKFDVSNRHEIYLLEDETEIIDLTFEEISYPKDRIIEYIYYIPSIQHKKFDPNLIKIKKFDTFNIEYKIYVYQTDYEEFIPKIEDKDSVDYKFELNEYANHLLKFANYVYINNKTHSNLHNHYHNLGDEIRNNKYKNYRYLGYYKDIELYYGINNNVTLSDGKPLEVSSGCVQFSKEYGEKVLHLDFDENLNQFTDNIGQYFDIKIFDSVYHLKYTKELASITNNQNKSLFLPLDVVQDLYKNGYFNNNNDNYIKREKTHIMNLNYMDIKDTETYSFMFDSLLDKNLSIIYTLRIISLITYILLIIGAIVSLMIYTRYVLLPDYKVNKILLCKNISKYNFVIIEYCPRIILTILSLIIAIYLGFFINSFIINMF